MTRDELVELVRRYIVDVVLDQIVQEDPSNERARILQIDLLWELALMDTRK